MNHSTQHRTNPEREQIDWRYCAVGIAFWLCLILAAPAVRWLCSWTW